jgi:acyl carrier protein
VTERIEDRLKQMLVDRLILKMDPRDVDENKSLADDYGVDSVCILEIVVGVEETFGVAVDDEDFAIENFRTIAAIADYVRKKQGNG